MKSLTIPTVTDFSAQTLEEISENIETFGVRIAVDSLNWKDAYPYKPFTDVFIARSNEMIYVKFNVKGNTLRAVCDSDQTHVFKDSCVEFFCKRADLPYYYNLEFSCIGYCYASKRVSRASKTELTLEQLSTIQRYSSLPKKPFKEIEGYFAWDLTIAVPFELLELDPNNLPEYIEGNFYKCADGTAFKHYVSWNPIDTEKPDFHRPEFFGRLYL